ncbi:hypothetical protein [Azospirillum doebereinerae]|uniref:Uncharacterized protein n=1 Tax=Azospirillum doebereinerae TaxID=92933 RepID=A0A3S1CE15_9PROT|nr:hypothetical protein [Azospirillum doebereinerae]RUQ65157.1 hypothetical protein EJ913_25770 [Azospirillum doebereinerae]
MTTIQSGSDDSNVTLLNFTDESATDDEIVAIDGEARIRDLTLGRDLEFDRPRDIRKLIERHIEPLRQFGTCATVARVVRGNAVTEYLLNRNQAIFIAAKSETPKATELVIGVIKKLDAYEKGLIAPAAPAKGLTLAERRVQVHELNAATKALDRVGKVGGSRAMLVNIQEVYGKVGLRIDLSTAQVQHEMSLAGTAERSA